MTDLAYIVADARRMEAFKAFLSARAYDLLEKVWRREIELPMSAGLGTVTLGSSRIVEPWGDVEEDRYAWPMIDVEKWGAPIAATGARQFWEWPA